MANNKVPPIPREREIVTFTYLKVRVRGPVERVIYDNGDAGWKVEIRIEEIIGEEWAITQFAHVMGKYYMFEHYYLLR